MKITWTVTYTLRDCSITRHFSNMMDAVECELTAYNSHAKNIKCECEISH